MKNKGFTFVELLVVMTLIAILFVTTAVTYGGISKSSRDSRRKADLEAVRQALELCRSFSGSYPATVVGGGTIVCSSQTYMTKVPVDPKTETVYTYTPSGTPPSAYTMSATLENTNDDDYPTYTVTNP